LHMAPHCWWFFFFLLVVVGATVVNCQDHAVNVTVSIQSKMGAGTTLSVHCRTDFRGRGVPIIDLGEHDLGDRERYSFVLVQPYPAKLDKQVYHCTFTAAGYAPAQVGVYWGLYFPHSPCECVLGLCPPWSATPTGIFCGRYRVRTWSHEG
jgi:hypothetical protein